MFTLKDLKNSGETSDVWKFLKSNSLREKVFDLILDIAFSEQKADTDVLHPDALRASAARVEFARRLDSMLPRGPEGLETRKPVTPTPVE